MWETWLGEWKEKSHTGWKICKYKQKQQQQNIADKGLASKIYKDLLRLSNMKKN